MSDKIYTIDELKKLVVVPLVNFGVSRVGLFGSYAKGKANKRSDIDLLVLLPDSFDPLKYMELERNLSEKTGKHIDILEYRCVADYMADYIFESEVRLYDEE